jgi:hypothetical protein
MNILAAGTRSFLGSFLAILPELSMTRTASTPPAAAMLVDETPAVNSKTRLKIAATRRWPELAERILFMPEHPFNPL